MLTFFWQYMPMLFSIGYLWRKNEKHNNYDNDSSVIYESNFKKNLSWTPIEEIPDFLQDAFVAVEDKRFIIIPALIPFVSAKLLSQI